MEIIISLILIFVAALLLFVIVMGAFFVIDIFLDLPYVGAKKDKIETIIKLAQIKKNETVIDLGSGDGRLLLAAAAKGAYAIGYELNPLSILISRLHVYLEGRSGNIMVHYQNMWQADLKVADVIFVYSLKKKIGKFEDFVYKNARPGTRILVNTNPFPHKKPTKSENGIYLYKV
jgi:cyclopropane fatty-acyl-phospholipid synthase-like methyltransferase